MNRLLCGLVALGPLLAAAGRAKADYVFTTIDPPGSNGTFAYGINEAGQVVGAYLGANGFHGFLWSGGQYTTLDLPGAMDTNAHVNKM